MSGGHPRSESSKDAVSDTGPMQSAQSSPLVRLAALLGRNAARQWLMSINTGSSEADADPMRRRTADNDDDEPSIA